MLRSMTYALPQPVARLSETLDSLFISLPGARRSPSLGSFSEGAPNLKDLLASFGFVLGGYPQNKGLIGFVWVRFLS